MSAAEAEIEAGYAAFLEAKRDYYAGESDYSTWREAKRVWHEYKLDLRILAGRPYRLANHPRVKAYNEARWAKNRKGNG